MNFASKKLNGFYKEPENLTDREKRLIAENQRLKKRNKRLSGAMLYLVTHVEKRLPFFNAGIKAAKEAKQRLKTTPIENVKPPETEQVRPKKPARKKIVGEAWTPENLNNTTRRKDPPSMQQILASKKRDREPSEDDTDISNVVFVDPKETLPAQETTKKTPLYERAQAAREATAPDDTDAVEETLPTEEISSEVSIATEETVATSSNDPTLLTPDLAPEEMNILAAPTRDKAQDIFHPQPSELMEGSDDIKPSAKEASRAYMAVSVAATPVPNINRVEKEEVSELDEDDLIIDQVARQNEVLRAAMLRRVNRLRW
ncbi:hypothetical protein [Sneathiella glossodoripedis]|uniref:hypothetical protein n=1 Tax=Sneathiella glossodoripedis TaxID=418853 RepID=UPI000472503D|nr:hypothetical protein [Sneathiella glossodoripedis]